MAQSAERRAPNTFYSFIFPKTSVRFLSDSGWLGSCSWVDLTAPNYPDIGDGSTAVSQQGGDRMKNLTNDGIPGEKQSESLRDIILWQWRGENQVTRVLLACLTSSEHRSVGDRLRI